MTTPIPAKLSAQSPALNARLAYLDDLSQAATERTLTAAELQALLEAQGEGMSQVGSPAIESRSPEAFSSAGPAVTDHLVSRWKPKWDRPASLDELEAWRATVAADLRLAYRKVNKAKFMGMGMAVFWLAALLAGFGLSFGTHLIAGIAGGGAIVSLVTAFLASRRLDRWLAKAESLEAALEGLEPARPYRWEVEQWRQAPGLLDDLRSCLGSPVGLLAVDVQRLREAWNRHLAHASEVFATDADMLNLRADEPLFASSSAPLSPSAQISHAS